MDIKSILIVDTEGSFEPREVGVLLFDLIYGTAQQYSMLIPHEMTRTMKDMKTNGTIDYQERVFASNRVAVEQVVCGIDVINTMIAKCDVIISHSKGQDKRIMSQLPGIHLGTKPWICTVQNFSWSISPFRSRSLQSLCNNFGVAYEYAHTALSDCYLLLQCLMREPRFQDEIQRCATKMIDRKIPKTLNHCGIVFDKVDREAALILATLKSQRPPQFSANEIEAAEMLRTMSSKHFLFWKGATAPSANEMDTVKSE